MPLKRLRSGGGGGAADPAPPPPLRLLYLPATPAGLTRADLETPADALAALLLLRAQFPAALAVGDRPCPPIALGSQVASLVRSAASPTARAAELAALAARRIVRQLRLPTLPGSAGGPASVAEAWVFESDFAAAAVSALQRAGGGREAAAAAACVRPLLAACPGPGLTHARLVSVLGRGEAAPSPGGGGGGGGGGPPGSPSSSPASSSSGDSLAHHPSLAGAAAVTGGRRPAGPPPPAVDAALASLLRVGVLARAVPRPGEGGGGGGGGGAAAERYRFAIPGGGGARFVKGVAAGRAALLGALRRRRGGVAPIPAPGARLGGAAVPLDARFVLRDCLGGGWVERVASPGGVMVRLAEGRVRDAAGAGGGRGRGR